jgi:tetratricopeptide (TPR) repeat protein
VGEVLEGRDEVGGAANLEVAWHFLRGGAADRAATTAIKGAERAIDTGALIEAQQILEVLLREQGTEHATQPLLLLLAKALLGQSRAESAASVLTRLSHEGDLSKPARALTTRMLATVEYLMNRELGSSYCDAADRALEAARDTGDLELIGTALFECARSGVNAGHEGRVVTVSGQTEHAISQLGVDVPPILWYTKAYCDFFFFELASAAASLESAIKSLNARQDLVGLSLAYTGYGTCKSGLCEFDAACDAYDRALRFSTRIGDDLKSAIITSNLCVAKLHQGDFASAVALGERAVAIASNVLTPRSVGIHLNLASARLMIGDRDGAERAIAGAERAIKTERSWTTNMEFLLGYACFALETGDLTLAMQLVESAERLAWGKERAVPNAGLFDKLRVYRLVHTSGPDSARSLVIECQQKYRDRHPYYYLDLLACGVWLDRLLLGRYTTEDESALALFETLGARGLRAILVAQGILV